METEVQSPARWELYKLLGEPARLRLLALAATEELTIGELADLLSESQPNVSRHLAPLRRAGLLRVRKQATRVLVRLADKARTDPVLVDALAAGRQLCEKDGSFERVANVIRARDAAAREFFARPKEHAALPGLPAELPAYIFALSHLLPSRRLAVDVGTGHGALLDVLAPAFEQVIAVDREAAQLGRARARLEARRYENVDVLQMDYDSPEFIARVHARDGADVVFASRVLHHAPRPGAAMQALASILSPNGHLLIIDYHAHEDETMRDELADLWLGFSETELEALASEAELEIVTQVFIPKEKCGIGPDSHVQWQVLIAKKQTKKK